jgi:hypothetical protein
MASIIVGVIFVCLGVGCAVIGTLLVHREIVAVESQGIRCRADSLSFM